MKNLIILSKEIRQHDGLYSLNDLHKASGSEAHKRPSLWVANQQTQELAAEISKAGIPALVSKRGGCNGGTYACKELVIAYAAWISAAFHLKVIRVFLDTQTQKSVFQNTTDKPITKSRRYYIEIKIVDNVFNGSLELRRVAPTLNAMITGLAKDFGYKINSMSRTPEGMTHLIE